MVEYLPPPENLDRLNIVQRYMQKRSLDKQDYIYLLMFVLSYIALRPYVQKAAKWLLAPKELKEGDEALKEHFQSKAKVGANTIRGQKEKSEPPEALQAGTSEVTTSGSKTATEGEVLNRKSKADKLTKSEQEQLLNWDDVPAPQQTEGDKSDVVKWLEKWDK